jgi:hypothetical protein
VVTPARAACMAATCPAVPPPAMTTFTVSMLDFIFGSRFSFFNTRVYMTQDLGFIVGYQTSTALFCEIDLC